MDELVLRVRTVTMLLSALVTGACSIEDLPPDAPRDPPIGGQGGAGSEDTSGPWGGRAGGSNESPRAGSSAGGEKSTERPGHEGGSGASATGGSAEAGNDGTGGSGTGEGGADDSAQTGGMSQGGIEMGGQDAFATGGRTADGGAATGGAAGNDDVATGGRSMGGNSGSGGAATGGAAAAGSDTGGTSGSSGAESGGAAAAGSDMGGAAGDDHVGTGGRDTGGTSGTGGTATGGTGTGGSGGAATGGTGGAETGGSAGSGGSSESPGCGTTTSLEGESTHAIKVGGTDRKYIVRLPDPYDEDHPYRLMIAYHWTGGTADSIALGQYYGLWELADDSTIFVAPQGAENQWANSGGADVDFTRALINELAAELCIDMSRIFAGGFNVGGAMAYALACAMHDTVRAIAVYSIPGETSGCSLADRGPVAYFMTHGTLDPLSPYPDMGVPEIRKFAALNGCTDAESLAMPTPTDTTGQIPACAEFSGCSAHHPTRACVFIGGHTMPSWIRAETWNFITRF